MDYSEQGYHARGVYLTGYLTHGNSKSEARGRGRHHNHSKIVVSNMKDRNAGTIKGKSRKQNRTSAEDLPIELHESSYPRLQGVIRVLSFD